MLFWCCCFSARCCLFVAPSMSAKACSFAHKSVQFGRSLCCSHRSRPSITSRTSRLLQCSLSGRGPDAEAPRPADQERAGSDQSGAFYETSGISSGTFSFAVTGCDPCLVCCIWCVLACLSVLDSTSSFGCSLSVRLWGCMLCVCHASHFGSVAQECG